MVIVIPGLSVTFQPQYTDIPSRLKVMDQSGVTMHALSLTQPMVYWATPAFGLKLSQAFNDACSALHLKYPERFVGLAMLPMQAPELAAEEAARAAKLPGIRGAYMSTHVLGKNLDEKMFWPVYEKCEALGLPIFLHPTNTLGADRMRSYYLRNFLGNPYETGIAAASLMFGGVMDAFPKLDVVLPHAGGDVPVAARPHDPRRNGAAGGQGPASAAHGVQTPLPLRHDRAQWRNPARSRAPRRCRPRDVRHGFPGRYE